jgi:hypothetical protein
MADTSARELTIARTQTLDLTGVLYLAPSLRPTISIALVSDEESNALAGRRNLSVRCSSADADRSVRRSHGHCNRGAEKPMRSVTP